MTAALLLDEARDTLNADDLGKLAAAFDQQFAAAWPNVEVSR